MNFELHLEDNLFGLFEDLKNNKYRHSAYERFKIFDNKKRDIYKAHVTDRIIHQIVYDYLLSLFEPGFIADSYSSRINKGQYKAISTFRYFIRLARSDYKRCLVLKCDVRKYFDNVNHQELLDAINCKVSCKRTFEIIKKIIFSYDPFGENKGIPLGNITSQIFANIYLDALDKYAKNELKCRFYARYNDDFVIVGDSKEKLERIRDKIITFAKEKLFLDIPIEKTEIRKVDWGIDFLGFVILAEAVLLRNKTKNKIYSNIGVENAYSYYGILKHCNSHNLKRKILLMGKACKIW